MSDRVPVDVHDDTDVQDELVRETSPVWESEGPREVAGAPAPAGSVLGRLRASREQLRRRSEVTLPLGAYDGLAARYRPLTDGEQKELDRQLTRARKLAKKVGSSDEDGTVRELESAALLLARSCVELLFVDDTGRTQPLVEVLAEEGVDTKGEQPMVWDRRTGQVLAEAGVIEGTFENAVQVVLHLHYHPGNDNHNALADAVQQWQANFASAAADSLEETLEGS